MKALKILILSHIRSRTSKVEPGFCIALVITSIPELVVKGRIEEGEAGRWTPTTVATLGPMPTYSGKNYVVKKKNLLVKRNILSFFIIRQKFYNENSIDS